MSDIYSRLQLFMKMRSVQPEFKSEIRTFLQLACEGADGELENVRVHLPGPVRERILAAEGEEVNLKFLKRADISAYICSIIIGVSISREKYTLLCIIRPKDFTLLAISPAREVLGETDLPEVRRTGDVLQLARELHSQWLCGGLDLNSVGRATSLALINHRYADYIFTMGAARRVLSTGEGDQIREVVEREQGGMLNAKAALNLPSWRVNRLPDEALKRERLNPETNWIEALIMNSSEARVNAAHIVQEAAYGRGLWSNYHRLFSRLRRALRHRKRIVLFVSLEAEKRAWPDQRDAFAAIFERLLREFREVHVYVNGLTGPATSNEKEVFDRVYKYEVKVIEEWEEAFGNRINVIHIHGLNIADKSKFISGCDFFIAPLTSAALAPTFLGIPGLCYGPAYLCEQAGQIFRAYSGIRIIHPNKLKHIEGELGLDERRHDARFHSYAIDANVFVSEFDAAFAVLNRHKDRKRVNEASV